MDLVHGEAENIHFSPAIFLAGKTDPRSRSHWERWEALRQLAMAHEKLAAVAWRERLNRYALRLGLEPLHHACSRQTATAEEQLRENRWATRQSSWYRQGKPRPGPESRLVDCPPSDLGVEIGPRPSQSRQPKSHEKWILDFTVTPFSRFSARDSQLAGSELMTGEGSPAAFAPTSAAEPACRKLPFRTTPVALHHLGGMDETKHACLLIKKNQRPTVIASKPKAEGLKLAKARVPVQGAG